MIRTIGVLLFLSLYILLLGLPFILHCLITGSPERLYRLSVRGAALALSLAGIRVRVEGLENIPRGVCLFVANHASNVDPPAVITSIPRRVALLAKKEVFRIPILSSAMRLGSFVPVDRSNRDAAIDSVERALEYVRRGVSYLVFPEGTRSPDGRLRPFKKGTFVMAIKAGVPVVPICVIGTRRLMPRGSFAIRPGEVVVRFLPPVDASAYALDEKETLIARVHAAMADTLPEEQRPAASEQGTADSPIS